MTKIRGGGWGEAQKQKEKRGFHNVTLCGWYCAPSYRQVYQSWQRLRVLPQHYKQSLQTEHIRTPTCTHTLVQVCIYTVDTSTIRYQRKYFTACGDSRLYTCVLFLSVLVCVQNTDIQNCSTFTHTHTHATDVVFGFVEAFINTVLNSPLFPLDCMQKCVQAVNELTFTIHTRMRPNFIVDFSIRQKSSPVSQSQITIFTLHLAFIFFPISSNEIGMPNDSKDSNWFYTRDYCFVYSCMVMMRIQMRFLLCPHLLGLSFSANLQNTYS